MRSRGDNRRMRRILTVISRQQQSTADLAYWRTRPMAERIAAVEFLRQQVSGATPSDNVEPRLQRVCRIAQRKRR